MLNVYSTDRMISFLDRNGEVKQRYEGENKKDSLVAFMRNPVAPPPKPAEEEWADVSKDVVHLGEADFDEVLQVCHSTIVLKLWLTLRRPDMVMLS